ncbi:MAG: LysM peptidoglycan-binding domain-containing protein [Flavobacterium sp.]|nr:MAG: LysM peptidoglycan-binding domain-containing protein [Flavobacterium sp.]
MFKKILALVILSILVSCGSSRSGVKTSKNGTAKTRTQTPRKKPAIRTTKPLENRTQTAGSTRNETRKTETLESTSRTVVYADLVKEYILEFKEIAKDNMRRHGIPASITLAQGILESGAGRGTLCVNANNHFGIKCHTGWEGETVRHNDDSEQECFRKYTRAAESYNDHSLFLTTRGRYAALFKLPKDDYSAWAHGLKAAGYATDPKYPDKLIGLIERYDLAGHDAEVLGRQYTPKQPAAPVVREPSRAVSQPEVVAMAEGSHRVQQGETLYSISKKHNTTVDDIIRLNGLSGNAISIGQVLKVK